MSCKLWNMLANAECNSSRETSCAGGDGGAPGVLGCAVEGMGHVELRLEA